MPAFTSPAPSFNAAALAAVFDHDNHANRVRFRELVDDPVWVPRYNVSLRYERELALERLRRLFESGVVSVMDFERNPQNVMTGKKKSDRPWVRRDPKASILTTAHEMSGMVDPSVTTKLTVQLNLFGGSVIKLGTERHRKYLKAMDDLSVIGCFGLTELGYGNNAVEMETTAKWDASTREFIINSPSVLSRILP